MTARFDASTRATLLTTTGLGVIVAWAPNLPHLVRLRLLLVAFLCWLVSVALTTIRGAVAARHVAVHGARQDRLWTMLAIGGISVAVLCAAQLEIIRVLWDRPDLSWNVDWRWTWNHAQAIARSSSVDWALDYAYAPIEYHVGPAWLAAAMERLAKVDMAHVLFGAVPVLSTLTTLIALMYVLTCAGVPRRLAALAAALTACMPVALRPSFLSSILDGPIELLFDADNWMFGTFMLNQHLGLAVGMSSLALFADRESRMFALVMSGLGLASLIQIKPQYFISLGGVAGLLAVGRWAAWPPFVPRSPRVLIACAVALVSFCLGMLLLPHYPSIFAPRVPSLGDLHDAWLRVQAKQYYFAGVEILFVPVFLALLVILLRPKGAWAGIVRTRLGPLAEPMAVAVPVAVVLAVLLDVIELPVTETVHARAAAVGLQGKEVAEDALFALTSMMFPLRLLLVSGVAAWLCKRLTSVRDTRSAIAVGLVGSLIVISPLPNVTRAFLDPMKGYEAVEDSALRQILRATPKEGSLLISSDLADPADGTVRSLRGFLLTAYEGRLFYAANIQYLNYLREDAGERLANLSTFFGSPWTSWHDKWLADTRITHVLVHERCLPTWWPQHKEVLSLVARRGAWSLLAPLSKAEPSDSDASRPSGAKMRPGYGNAQCLN